MTSDEKFLIQPGGILFFQKNLYNLLEGLKKLQKRRTMGE